MHEHDEQATIATVLSTIATYVSLKRIRCLIAGGPTPVPPLLHVRWIDGEWAAYTVATGPVSGALGNVLALILGQRPIEPLWAAVLRDPVDDDVNSIAPRAVVCTLLVARDGPTVRATLPYRYNDHGQPEFDGEATTDWNPDPLPEEVAAMRATLRSAGV